MPDRSSTDADYGTKAHEMAAKWLRKLLPRLDTAFDAIEATPPEGFPDEEMKEGVWVYVQALLAQVLNYRKLGAAVTLHIEQRLPISMITGEKDAEGTADAVIIADFGEKAWLEVWDLKFGTGVPVSPVKNGQLMMYGLSALIRYGALHNITDVDLVIHQPRLSTEPKRWNCTPDELYAFGAIATEKAARALYLRDNTEALENLTPGEKQCRFCRYKTLCPAYARWVDQNVLAGFEGFKQPESITTAVEGRALTMTQEQYAAWLGEQRKKVDFANAWCEAISAESDRLARAGVRVPGWKLVDGRAGNRFFPDEEGALTIVTLHGIKRDVVMTKPELVSPAQLEKLLPPKLNRALWADLKGDPQANPPVKGFVAQKPASVALVPESDPRPERQNAAKASDFEVEGES